MKRVAAVVSSVVLFLLTASLLRAQALPELFQKVKAEVKSSSWQDAIKTLDKLDAEAAKPENEKYREQIAGPSNFYRGVCEANLDHDDAAVKAFAEFVSRQPNASIDRAMYSKKAIAAFETAQKQVASPLDARVATQQQSNSLFTAFQEFKAPPNSSDPADERWADGPVKWIMAPDERVTWNSLATGGERQEFVDKFWEKRNPKPGSSDNVFRTTFERRVAFADSRFIDVEKQRGSLSDRGMVFVLLGPPTWAGRKPLRTGEDTSDASGLSTFDAAQGEMAVNAARAASGSGKISSAKTAQLSGATTYGPGSSALESANNYREVWHYRRELLPKSAPYQQVDFDFITKKGYGANVLQRDPTAINTMDAAKINGVKEQ
jgi:GWxTD domain-containing protein